MPAVPLCPRTHLMAPPGHAGGNVAAGRVPLDVRGHEVFRAHHDLARARPGELVEEKHTLGHGMIGKWTLTVKMTL